MNSIETNLQNQDAQQQKILSYQQKQVQITTIPNRYSMPRRETFASSSTYSRSFREGSNISDVELSEGESRMDLDLEEAEGKLAGTSTNPLEVVKESFELVEETVDGGKRVFTGSGVDKDYGIPDVVRRGILTEVECQDMFNTLVLTSNRIDFLNQVN